MTEMELDDLARSAFASAMGFGVDELAFKRAMRDAINKATPAIRSAALEEAAAICAAESRDALAVGARLDDSYCYGRHDGAMACEAAIRAKKGEA